MNSIPKATADKLATPFPEGTRHKAKLDIAIPLIADGLPESAVFATLREKFPNAKDSEIRGVIEWVKRQPFSPSTKGNGYTGRPWTAPKSAPRKRTPEEQVEWWTGGAVLMPDDMAAASPVSIPRDRVDAAELAFSVLYQETDRLNIICKFILDNGKAKPCGPGRTDLRDGWLSFFKARCIPSSEAGAWIRINPCDQTGHGTDGAMTDADVTAFRYALIEFDSLPIAKQLALFARWRLPIAAVILSGGSSAHAWVRVEAADGRHYRELTDRLYDSLKVFGIDPANKNASRLCRLPGAIRKIGAVDSGEQRLLWLNPSVQPLTQDALAKFEDTLAFPFVDNQPLMPVAQEAISRYEWMRNNVGKLGVPSGIPQLDATSGGFKPGQSIVVAGETGAGKSTLGLHLIVSALNAGHGVLLFSLEMDREEIFDLLVANYCSINRNKFNTGEFTDYDLMAMAKEMPKISKMPLYIEDSAMSDADQIKARVMQLKGDGKIALAVVDYIQFVNPGFTKENREQQVAGISHTLRTVAREAKLPMIILSQLNDEGRLRESRVIAHNANVVMVVKTEGDVFTVSVVKGRGIPTGDYKLTFDRLHARLVPEEVKGPIDPADIPAPYKDE